MTNYHVPVQTSVPVATPVTNEVPEVAVTEDMKTAYSLSKTTKFLCLIDFAFSLIYAFSNPYFYTSINILIGLVGR